jgi:murein DD-endopeptidase MepM/ murein hydrolase activator NlpD
MVSMPLFDVYMPAMKPIVESKGVKLYCSMEGRYAFFNSPFPAHKANTGVDIYPGDGFGGEAPSPVDGEVVLIRRVKAPEGHGFTAADHDTVVVLRNKDNSETVTKLLHIDPLVEVGDTVRVGDPVGLTLRSGYYGWGTSPHIHTEIRDPRDPIRARGGYNLDLIEVPKGDPVDMIAGAVVHLQPEFALIELESLGSGLVGTVNGEPATLDGGIPYYDWMGAHLLDPPSSGTIELLGTPIADITQSFKHSCKAACRKYQFTIDKQEILGLSLNLWLRQAPIVKVIPFKKKGLNVKIEDWVEIELKVS